MFPFPPLEKLSKFYIYYNCGMSLGGAALCWCPPMSALQIMQEPLARYMQQLLQKQAKPPLHLASRQCPVFNAHSPATLLTCRVPQHPHWAAAPSSHSMSQISLCLPRHLGTTASSMGRAAWPQGCRLTATAVPHSSLHSLGWQRPPNSARARPLC